MKWIGQLSNICLKSNGTKVIYENMRVQASEITARQAKEVVENSAKARDKVIEDAKNS